MPFEVSPSQGRLHAVPPPLLDSSHPSHPGVSEQHKYCASIDRPGAARGAGDETRREAHGPAGSSVLGSQPCLCRGLRGLLSPARLQQDLVPAHFQPAHRGKLPQAAVSIFPLCCLLLFGELESMIKFETWLALASDATGFLFSFQIGLSLSTSSPGQLEGSTALL